MSLNFKLKYFLIPQLLSFLPFRFLIKITKQNILLPYYHMINDEILLHIKNLYQYKNVNMFKQDIDFFLRNYNPITLNTLIEKIKTGDPIPPKSFLLSFDDGFKEMYEIVAPLLLKKGLSAIFFINSAFINNKELCYHHKASIIIEKLNNNISENISREVKKILDDNLIEIKNNNLSILNIDYQKKCVLDEISNVLEINFDDYLSSVKPYLTTDQIQYLIKNGFFIGSHSIDHPSFNSLTFEEQLKQTIKSTIIIKNKFNLEYSAFAFPVSDSFVSDKYFSELEKTNVVDLTFGNRGLLNDPVSFHFQRISMEKPLIPAEKIVFYQYYRYIFKHLMGKSKINRI